MLLPMRLNNDFLKLYIIFRHGNGEMQNLDKVAIFGFLFSQNNKFWSKINSEIGDHYRTWIFRSLAESFMFWKNLINDYNICEITTSQSHCFLHISLTRNAWTGLPYTLSILGDLVMGTGGRLGWIESMQLPGDGSIIEPYLYRHRVVIWVQH